MTIPDDVWQVMAETMQRYKGIAVTAADKQAAEDKLEIIPFDGGCFLMAGNELDCFVRPDKRGRWMKRGLLNRVFGDGIKKHGSLVCRIHKDNARSLSTAKRLGFEVVEQGEIMKLEMKSWKF